MKYLSTTNKIYIYETRNYAKNGGLSDQPEKRGPLFDTLEFSTTAKSSDIRLKLWTQLGAKRRNTSLIFAVENQISNAKRIDKQDRLEIQIIQRTKSQKISVSLYDITCPFFVSDLYKLVRG